MEGHFENVEEDLKVRVVASEVVVGANVQSWFLGCLSCLLVDVDWDVAMDAGLLGGT